MSEASWLRPVPAFIRMRTSMLATAESDRSGRHPVGRALHLLEGDGGVEDDVHLAQGVRRIDEGEGSQVAVGDPPADHGRV